MLKVKKENILLILGKCDLYVYFEDIDYLWEFWERFIWYIYICGYVGIVFKCKKIVVDIINFI